MRKFINIVENAQNIHDFTKWVTDDLLDEIISSGMWVVHGSELSEQWDAGVFDSVVESTLIGQPWDTVRHTPEFREALRVTAVEMAIRANRDIAKITPNTTLYRGLSSDDLKDGRTGVYWSVDERQSASRFLDSRGNGLLLRVRFSDVTVDWYQTFRSRIDTGNGGDEEEIQLQAGSPVKDVSVIKVFDHGSSLEEIDVGDFIA